MDKLDIYRRNVLTVKYVDIASNLGTQLNNVRNCRIEIKIVSALTVVKWVIYLKSVPKEDLETFKVIEIREGTDSMKYDLLFMLTNNG